MLLDVLFVKNECGKLNDINLTAVRSCFVDMVMPWRTDSGRLSADVLHMARGVLSAIVLVLVVCRERPALLPLNVVTARPACSQGPVRVKKTCRNLTLPDPPFWKTLFVEKPPNVNGK